MNASPSKDSNTSSPSLSRISTQQPLTQSPKTSFLLRRRGDSDGSTAKTSTATTYVVPFSNGNVNFGGTRPSSSPTGGQRMATVLLTQGKRIDVVRGIGAATGSRRED